MEAKAIILPTDTFPHKGDIMLWKNGLLGIMPTDHFVGQKQHIYLTDPNAETKEGDWYYFKVGNKDKISRSKVDKGFGLPHYKIICSTDKALKIERSATGYTENRVRTFTTKESVPQLSKQSTQLLIDYYNKNGKMPDEVEVEESIVDCVESHEGNTQCTILNSQGEVDITIPEEKMISINELPNLLNLFCKDHSLQKGIQIMDWDVKKWIRDNYKSQN